MNSAQAVAKKMRDMKITNKQFFTSNYFIAYLRLAISHPFRVITRRSPSIKVEYDSKPQAPAAYTDGRTIVINAAARLVAICKNRVAKTRVITGMMVHEYGHMRFTDFKGREKACEHIGSGTFYPELPDGVSVDIRDNHEDFCEFIAESEENARTAVSQWHTIYNILEDGYIEESLYHVLTGELIDGLNFLRRKQLDDAYPLTKTLKALEEGKMELLPVMHNLLLMYAKYGTIKANWRTKEGLDSEPVKLLRQCMKYTDPILYEPNTQKRLNGVNLTFLQLWPIIKEFISAHPDSEERDAASRAATGTMSSEASSGTSMPMPVAPEEDTGRSGSDKARALTKDALRRTDGDAAPSSGDEESSIEGEKSSHHDEDPGMVDILDGERIEDYIETEDAFDSSEMEASISRMERSLAESAAIDAVNEELTRELRDEANGMDYGAAHKGIYVTVERINKVSDERKESESASEILSRIEGVAKIAARKCAAYLKKDTTDPCMSMSGFFSGGKFDASRLVMNDYRVFRRNTTPEPDTRTAITVLVDESGSMYGNRIDAAKAAALAVYMFCQELGVKCSVVGHSLEGTRELALRAYADFDTPDKDDKYRILDISAHANNRDGAAIHYVGTRLLKRDEPIKLLVVISDGAPLAPDYYGVAAENDVANIVAGLRRRGVVIFSAAIGSDKDSIQRIYGDGFIDISDLNTLPNQLLSLIKRYIK